LLLLLPFPFTFQCFLFLLIFRRPPLSPLFPYTTLFRSVAIGALLFMPLQYLFYYVAMNWLWMAGLLIVAIAVAIGVGLAMATAIDRKSTRLNSSHVSISYAVFCLKKKNTNIRSAAVLSI